MEGCCYIDHNAAGTPASIFCHEAFDVDPEIDIGRAVNRITDWMNTCKEKHSRCSSRPSILPWRVLDIRSLETAGTIRLVETTGTTGEYVALSHCWGKNRPMITTTGGNLSKRKAGIAFSDLSKTFQDAVRLTYAIKVPYIWIDSLCIIQDSKDDWEAQSSQMASIYANSTLNIAATAARDGDHGLFRSRSTPGHENRCSIQSYEIPGSLVTFGSTHYIRHSLVRTHEDLALQLTTSRYSLVETAPLLSRGWVLQERLLSPRTVNFHSGEMAWDCNSHFKCECGSFEFDPILPRTHMGKHQWLSKRSVAGAEDTHTMIYRWHQLIEQYLRLSLTKDNDILPAFSGIARHFQDLFSRIKTDQVPISNGPTSCTKDGFQDKVPDQYLAGLWRQSLWRNLLWYITRTGGFPQERRTATYRAPTWSWASMDLQDQRKRITGGQPLYLAGPISEFRYIHGVFDQEPHFTVIHSQCSLVGANAYGAVTGGLLKIRGLVAEVPMVWDTSSLALNFKKTPIKSFRDREGRERDKEKYIHFDTDIRDFLDEPGTEFKLEVLILGVSEGKPWKGIVIWRSDERDQYIRIGCLNIYISQDPDIFLSYVSSIGVKTVELV
jgi:hypothetical protein